MPELGGIPYDSERFQKETLRAEVAAIASGCCYEHGARMAAAVLARFNVTRRSIKEPKDI